MTATADKQLQRGIVQSLGLRHPKRIVMPVKRPNLHYSVLPTMHVTDAVLRALQKIPGKAVVFCRLRARTESLAERLNRAGIPAAAYHAGLNREERSRVVQAYLSGRIRVVTATSAFGMGVDIPDIRLILHDHLPTNMIDYVQQSGRAGRDGETAYALLLFSPADLLRFHTRCQQIRVQHKHRPFTQYALIQRGGRTAVCCTSVCKHRAYRRESPPHSVRKARPVGTARRAGAAQSARESRISRE